MVTLIYKRTHNGDPDPESGVFGCSGCMGQVRGWIYDAVIGVGGIGREPANAGIAERLTWIGVGAHRAGDLRQPTVTFDHFWYRGSKGPMLQTVAPALARRIYGRNVRVIKDAALTKAELADVKKLLGDAMRAPPSRGKADASSSGAGSIQRTGSGKCRPCRLPRGTGC